MNLINEVDKPMVKKTVVVYAGRFQPFHKGHYAAYSKLVSKFGSDNVYIGTSNDQSGDKSPFNFKEKKEIATKMFGIPASKFIQIKNPYKPIEILNKFDGKTTAYIAAVGEKDATRLHGKYFKPYNNKTGYGYDEIGYVYPVPAERNPISGTDVRNNLGSGDEEKAKKFFLKAYPKFDKEIYKLITNKLIKENFPGGIGTGLVLPGGYINGAPTGSETATKEVYDPIAQVLFNSITEDDFQEFLYEYLGEKENPALDKDISYTNTKGQQKKIKARDALRLPKDHPAHIQAKRLTGDDTATGQKSAGAAASAAQQKKPDISIPGQKAGTVVKKGDGKPDLAMPGKDKEAKPGVPKPPPPPPPPPPQQKLSGADLKSSAEMKPADKKQEKIKQDLDKAKKELSKEDNETIEKVNNPESSERKGMVNNIKSGLKKFGKGIKHWADHKKEMVIGTADAVKSLATTGKLGSVKDKDGKSRHWSEFTEAGSSEDGWGSKMKTVPVYKKDKHGNEMKDKDGNPIQDKSWTGKPKTKKVPVFREGLSDDERELAESSWKKRNEQMHHVKHFAKDVALIMGSMALGGAGVAAAKAIGAGAGAAAAGSAAAHGAVGVFTHGVGGFAAHLGKDIAKHAALETLGLGATSAAGGGAALSTATLGILEIINEENSNSKFVSNVINKVVEKMSTYKLSDKQMLDSIKSYQQNKPKQDAAALLAKEHYVSSTGMFNRKLSVQQKIDKLNPARAIEKSKIWHQTFAHHNPETGEPEENDNEISESKHNTIQHFVEWATKRLKLNETPKVSLLSGNQYSNNQSSLGGYNPESKEIFVQVEKRLTADILRTIAHEMVHRKQDEMGLIGDSKLAGKDGSSVENGAHAVAGILMREYGRINKEIYNEGINTKTHKPHGTLYYEDGDYDTIKTESNETEMIDGIVDMLNQVKDINNRKKMAIDRLKDFKKNNIKINPLDFLGRIGLNETIKKVGNKYVVYPKNGGKRLGTHTTMASAKKQLAAIEINKEDISVDVNKGDTVLMGKFKNKKVQVKDIGKDQHGMPTINGKQATTFRKLNEVSSLDDGDDQPNGAWLPKNSIRELGANDGVNKKDNWFRNGGYTQTDFPVADAIFGDEDELETYIQYKDDNTTFVKSNKTEFPKSFDKVSVNEYQKLSQAVLRDIYGKNEYDNKINESAWNVLFNILSAAATAAITPLIVSAALDVVSLVADTFTKIKDDVKRLINPDEMDRISKIIDNDKAFNTDVIRLISSKKGVKNIIPNKFSSELISLPSFKKLFDKFTKENNLSEIDKQNLLKNIKVSIANSFLNNSDKIVKRLKNQYPEVAKGKQLDESILLNEGGAYGHMSHPFDDMQLTFGELKDIIIRALDGELGIVREKTDGQALAISWKNGRLIAARNKGHLANAGANAMGIEDVASKFAGRGGLTDAYNFAMKDLSAAISGLSQKQKEKIFNEGKCFMNLEVIWPESVNVIPYGQALLIFHNTTCYDESGKAIDADQSAARTLAGMIKQVNADVQSKYTIQGPPITQIPKNENLSSKKGKYLSKLSKLQSEFNCTNSDTMAVYHQHWWENFIDTKAPVKVDKLTKEALVRRWAFGEKSFKLNTISNPELQSWAINTDKVNVPKQQKENMKPFEEIFLGVGADVLEFVGSVLTVHPDKAIRAMKDKLKQVAAQIKTSTDASKILKFKNELERLNSLGGIDRIVASEGLVFYYNGKTYKLTGTFAPLNQLLGIFYE